MTGAILKPFNVWGIYGDGHGVWSDVVYASCADTARETGKQIMANLSKSDPDDNEITDAIECSDLVRDLLRQYGLEVAADVDPVVLYAKATGQSVAYGHVLAA